MYVNEHMSTGFSFQSDRHNGDRRVQTGMDPISNDNTGRRGIDHAQRRIHGHDCCVQ